MKKFVNYPFVALAKPSIIIDLEAFLRNPPSAPGSPCSSLVETPGKTRPRSGNAGRERSNRTVRASGTTARSTRAPPDRNPCG